MPEDVPLGTLLRRHRRAAGMTLEEAAETSGVSAVRSATWNGAAPAPRSGVRCDP
jgi:transcriptional regulator with XRE-family HTH domain